MRAFLAITLPDEIKARLSEMVQRLAPSATDVKWYDKNRFHLTLAYLGETSPAILPHVTLAAERVCTTLKAFTCRAYGLGFFGTKRNPQTVWVGVDPAPALIELNEGLWRELKKFGYETDDPDFRPHVTLGRCRESARNLALIEAMNAEEEVSFGTWTVSHVTLYESRLSPRGAVYRKLSHISLA